MKVKKVSPPTTGFLQVELDQEIIGYLWKIIKKANLEKQEFKSKLVGNISHSYKLLDEDDYFYRKVCSPLVDAFRKTNNGRDPYELNTKTSEKTSLLLTDFWVNYQYQTEFNPYHDHSGVYSFAIWMKIPYDWKEQSELPQFQGIEIEHRKAGLFEFEFLDLTGETRTLRYPLSPEFEGKMVFFPARLRHCVYPFYGTEEPRISLAGNLWFVS